MKKEEELEAEKVLHAEEKELKRLHEEEIKKEEEELEADQKRRLAEIKLKYEEKIATYE